MSEKERGEIGTVLIPLTSEDSVGTSSMEGDNFAITGPSTSDISLTPRERV